ncbi:hypothetical protein LCGC14_2197220 [marine sediment metagenome]|uniref:Uncharacterized protein n=1 Tax=marine sediment metagenome TaxID=412755 RepID=A0A0F9E4Y8_9ZZZZ
MQDGLVTPLHDHLYWAANADEEHGQTRKLSSAVREDLWVDGSVMAAIGDDHNDLPMLRGVGISAAPADASEALRAAADLTVAPRGQRPVAQFVAALLGTGDGPPAES